MLRVFRDPISGLSHLLGAILAVIGLIYLVHLGIVHNSATLITAFSIFGVSMTLLYASSALYHLLHLSEKALTTLRRVDHMMIFVLIAGSYTPFCLVPLHGPWGWTMLSVSWTLAIAGFLVKIFWLDAPRHVGVGFYLGMGWVSLIAIVPLFEAVNHLSFAWMVVGGVFYTLGACIYAFKKPDPFPGIFGFHEIWHLFVLAGSASHFASVRLLVP